MANQRIVVDIIGNDSSFQAALARSNAAASKFGSSVSKSLGGGGVSVAAQFDPLLARVRETRARAEELSQQLHNMDDGFKESAAGAGVLGGGLGSLLGRATAVGFAVNAAYQASQHLADALKTTGNEAFTTSGKLRNFGSALLSGDLVGGVEALRAAPKTFEDLGISVARARNILDGLSQSGVKLKDLPPAVQELLQSMKDVVGAADAADNATNALADSTARLGQVYRDATGQAVLFKGAVDDLAGPRGPGGVDQINANLEVERAGKFRQAAQTDNRVNANKQIIAQANKDLDELLRLQVKERDRLKEAVKSRIGNETERKALQDAYVRAQADVISTGKTIEANAAAAKAATEAAAKAQAAANKAAADAAARARADGFAKLLAAFQLGVDRAALTKPLGDDLRALEALKGQLERQIRAGVNVGSAQSQLVGVLGQIADKQAQIRQNIANALQAKQFRELGLSATGDEVTPSVANLAKRLKTVLARVDSGDLDISGKLVAHLREAQKAIAKEGDELTRITREKINEFIKAANGDNKTEDAFKFRVPNFSDKFKDLGLTPQQLIAVRSAFSRIGPGGLIPQFTATGGAFGFGGGTNVGTGATIVNVNGNIVTNDPEKFIRDMQRRAQRTTVARTGPMSGRQVS